MGPGRAMSGIGRRGGGLALLAALWLAGCAQAPKDLYSWETFARQQHEVLRADGVQSAQQIQDMEAHAQKVRGEGAALPPGFRAHLGMLYLNTGNAEQAGALWQAEKEAFPESSPYMDRLLDRLRAGTADRGTSKTKS